MAGPVLDGETVRFSLTMPDGTREDITLTAATDATGLDNAFQIDVDPNVTAANLEAAIEQALDFTARRDLTAASGIRAGADFFDNNPPLRVVPDAVDGIAGATAATADATGTVIWYQGEDGPLDSRLTRTSRIDDGVQIAYGARANEDALRTTLRELAVFSIQEFDVNDASSADRYTEMTLRTRAGLDDPSSGNLPRSIALEIGTASTLMQSTEERHRASRAVMMDVLQTTDGITQEEVAARILSTQTRLEATYSVTALLRDLSLVNFLR